MDAHTVCLVSTPSPFLLDERVFPFLGILKVAAALEHRGFKVEMLDLSGIKNYTEAVADHAMRSCARYWGITATTPQMPAAASIVETLRAVRPDVKTILGGTHATLVAASLRSDAKRGRTGRAQRAWERLQQHFDVVVAGDGEGAIFEALRPDAPPLIDADDRRSPLWLSNELLDATPFPARHLIDLESYRYRIDGHPATSLIAQLGCPFPCGFCGGRKSPMLRHIRTRSTENIVAEMEQLYRTWGYTGFMFYDDELNVSTSMVELMQAIARKQRELGVEWRLRGFVKSELFTAMQAKTMYEAGFRWLLVGFEAGSPRILENIQKRATREDNSRCIAIAKEHGLKVKALMSLGHPGESLETIRQTKEWLIESQPEDFDATIITPYPGSPYYDDAEPHGKDWVYTTHNGDRLYQVEVDYTRVADYYKGKPGEGYVSHVYTDELTSDNLVRERDALEHEVRQKLGIPWNSSTEAVLYEHSMGQTSLPDRILRSTALPQIAVAT